MITVNFVEPQWDGKEKINRVTVGKLNPQNIVCLLTETFDGKISNNQRTYSSPVTTNILEINGDMMQWHVGTELRKNEEYKNAPYSILETVKQAGVTLLSCRLRRTYGPQVFVEGNINVAHLDEKNVHPHLWNPLSHKTTISLKDGETFVVDEKPADFRGRLMALKTADSPTPSGVR